MNTGHGLFHKWSKDWGKMMMRTKCFLLFFLFASFAYAKNSCSTNTPQKNHHLLTLDDNSATFRSLKGFCQDHVGTLVVNVGTPYFVASHPKSKNSSCLLRPLENSRLFNDMVMKLPHLCDDSPRPKLCPRRHREYHLKPQNLDNCVFSKIPLGKIYKEKDFVKDFQLGRTKREVCEDNLGRLLTQQGSQYFLVTTQQKIPTQKDCMTRKDFQKLVSNDGEHFRGKCYRHRISLGEESELTQDHGAIRSLPGWQLSQIPVGDPFSKFCDKTQLPVAASELFMAYRSTSEKKKLCAHLNRQIVSFHDEIFYVENCQLRSLKPFSLKVQMKLSRKGERIQELTPRQRLGIPRGKVIEPQELLKKI